jgi:acyl carrier protein
MTDEEALALSRWALTEVAPEKASMALTLTLDSKIAELGVDSLQAMAFFGVIEDRLARTFRPEEISRAETFRAVAVLIQSKLSNG